MPADFRKRSVSALAVKRALKRVKIREIRRLCRLANLLKKKRTTESTKMKTERKLMHIAEKIESIKDIDLTSLSQELVKNQGTQHIVDKPEVEEDASLQAKVLLVSNEMVQKIFEKDRDEPVTVHRQQSELVRESEKEIAPATHSAKKRRQSKKPKDKTSAFVSKFSSDTVASKQKNRLGQRMRQRMWEKKYGPNAKHLQTMKKDSTRRTREKEQSFRLAPMQKTKRQKDSSHLHPSWQASKKRKAESISIDAFQGKRTTFSDTED